MFVDFVQRSVRGAIRRTGNVSMKRGALSAPVAHFDMPPPRKTCRGHENHPCQLARKKTDLNKIKKPMKDAQYICKNCGGETNLCAHEKL